jgi:phosphoribosylformimino-5-aminoimidazole carboxamide ribotide isomerase
MQIIPALDLLGHDAVRLERGDYDRVIFRRPVDDVLPVILATGPSRLHIVDLEGARDGQLRLSTVRACVDAASGLPVQVSGGIRNVATARAALDLGADRVIVGTALWSDPDALDSWVAALGAQLIAGIDVREGMVASHGWKDSTHLDVDEALERCRSAGVSRLHVTAISRDGTMSGPDLDLYRRVCRAGIPVVAAGGVRGSDDVDKLAQIGCEAAIMGMALLHELGLTSREADTF